LLSLRELYSLPVALARSEPVVCALSWKALPDKSTSQVSSGSLLVGMTATINYFRFCLQRERSASVRSIDAASVESGRLRRKCAMTNGIGNLEE
jgi:hypothetical protein